METVQLTTIIVVIVRKSMRRGGLICLKRKLAAVGESGRLFCVGADPIAGSKELERGVATQLT